MFDRRRDDAGPELSDGSDAAPDRECYGFGPAAREDDLVGLSSEGAGDRRARVVEQAPGGKAVAVHAERVRELVEGGELRRARPLVERGRGCVIQVRAR